MVMMIGFVTMGALVWVIATSMAGESDSEKRRVIVPSGYRFPPIDAADGENNRQAA